MLFAGSGGGMGTESGQSTEESIKTSTQRVHKSGTCIIHGTSPTAAAVCPKERTAPHDTSPHENNRENGRNRVDRKTKYAGSS